VICDKNCKFEGMTKEQIYTAIAQAVKSGYIGDINTGFVQTIKTINNQPLKFFVGAQSEYDALSEEDKENLFAIITNGTTKEDLIALLENHEERIALLERYQQSSHASTADRASYANEAGKLSKLQTGKDDVYRPVWFSDSDSEGLPCKDTGGWFTYNPAVHSLRVNLDGTAYQAERDIYENKIHEYYMPREESSYLRVASVSGTGLLKIYNTFLLNGCPEGKNKNNVFALEIQLQNEEFGSVSMVGFPIKTNHSDRLEFNVLGAGLSDEQTTEFKIKATVVFRSDGMIEVIPSKYQYHINYYKTTDYTISTDATVTLYFR